MKKGGNYQKLILFVAKSHEHFQSSKIHKRMSVDSAIENYKE
jgi:hypothetical protein